MKLHLNITGKLALILMLFGAGLLGSLGALAYASGRAGLQEAATAELLSAAFEKRSAFERWLAEARINITAQAASPVIVQQAAILLSAAPDSPQAQAAHDNLIGEFQPTVDPETAFIDLFFIDAETGQVLASTDPNEEGKFKESQSYFINGKVKPYVSEVYYSISLSKPAITAAAPVVAEDGRLLGVVAGRLDMNILNSLISQRTGLRHSDDSFLVNAAGLLVTQPRFLPDPVVLQHSIHTVATDRCLEGNSGIALYDDYRGQAVIGAYRWLPAYRVCLITKFDQSEAFASSQSFGRTVAWAAAVTLVLSVALAIVLARKFSRPILALQTGAARIGGGEMDFRLPETSSDEMGQLAREFNHMAEALQQRAVALGESEKNYRSLVENTMVGVYKTNTAGEILYVNPALAHMMGFDSAEEMRLGGVVARYKHPETRQRLLETLRQAGRAESFEAEVLTQQGQTKTILLSATLERDTLSGMVTDITERKRAERVQDALSTISQAAVTTESLPDLYPFIHRALGNLMPTDNFYIALYDPDTDLISFPFFVDQHDEPLPPKKPGRGLTEYVLRTGRPLLADPKVFAQLVQQGEVELVGTNSVDWLGVPLKTGAKVLGVIVVQSYMEGVRLGAAEKEMLEFVSTQVASAIERKLAQQRIADALKFNNILIDSSTLGISAYDASGQCILANEAIARIVGATRQQVLGQNYHHIASWKKSGLLDSAREAVTSGNHTRREIHTRSTFGKEIWLDCRFTPFVSDGKPHLLLTIDDISITKQAEVALQTYAAKLEQSNRDLQEFAYVASHDLQEPLRKVQAFSDRLATRYTDALDETGRDYLKRMRDASQRMQILITDLLSFSRISTRAQPFAEADLNTITREALSDLESRIEHAQAHVEVGQLPMLKADPTQMHQLLQNLIGNALKFHDGQRPCLIKISAKIEGETCRISVEDNGIGFDVQYLDRIFKPFQRLHNREEYEGSGMGLAICRRIVERHGGSITADSASGQGTTFLVSLPIHGPQGDQ